MTTRHRMCSAVMAVCVMVAAGIPMTLIADANEDACGANLKILGGAIYRYLIITKGSLPAKPSDLFAQGLVPDLSCFCCPASGIAITDAAQIDSMSDYAFTSKIEGKSPYLLIRDKMNRHEGQALGYYSDQGIRKQRVAGSDVTPPVVAEATGTVSIAGPVVVPPVVQPTTSTVSVAGLTQFGALFKKGCDQYAQRQYADAAVTFQQALQLHAADAPAQNALGMCFYSLGRYQESATPLAKAVELVPKHAAYRVSLGNALLAQQKYADAEALYRAGLQASPGIASLYCGLAGALAYQGKYDAAVVASGYAVQVEPTNAWYQLRLAVDLFALRRYAESEKACTAALQINSSYADAYNTRGDCRYNLGRHAEAEQDYRAAVTLVPNNGMYRANFAGALYALRYYDAAREQAQAALQLGYKTHWVFSYLGLVRQ